MMSLAIYRFVGKPTLRERVRRSGCGRARYDGLRELLSQQLQSLPPGTVP